MNEALTALNANVGAMLLVLNLSLALLVKVLIRHTSAMRSERALNRPARCGVNAALRG